MRKASISASTDRTGTRRLVAKHVLVVNREVVVTVESPRYPSTTPLRWGGRVRTSRK